MGFSTEEYKPGVEHDKKAGKGQCPAAVPQDLTKKSRPSSSHEGQPVTSRQVHSYTPLAQPGSQVRISKIQGQAQAYL